MDHLITEHTIKFVSQSNGLISSQDRLKKVLSEVALKILINGDEFVSIMTLNQDILNLALGFLYNEGLIHSREDVTRLEYNSGMFAVIIELREGLHLNTDDNVRSITSGCGKGVTYINPLKTTLFKQISSDYTVAIPKIWELMSAFVKKSDIFRDIGGIHSSYLVHGQFDIFSEDLGRHNCVDKIAGNLLSSGRINETASSMLLTTGRISSEIMAKVIRLGIPIVISRSAPTAAAITLAQKYQVAVLGYVRGETANIYSCAERIILE